MYHIHGTMLFYFHHPFKSETIGRDAPCQEFWKQKALSNLINAPTGVGGGGRARVLHVGSGRRGAESSTEPHFMPPAAINAAAAAPRPQQKARAFYQQIRTFFRGLQNNYH